MSTLSQFAAGGIKSIQRGIITMSGTSTTATISSVDVNKAFVSYLGQSTGTTSTDPTRYRARLALTSSTQVTATIGSSIGNSTLSYEVIEFY